ncbi:MAG: BatD family protein [Pseudomonadota bacterium]
MVVILYRIFSALLLLVCANAVLGSVKVTVDRDVVHIDEFFQLHFEIDASVNTNPDFSPLEKNFEILGRSQSTSINMVNGNYRALTRWTLDLMAINIGQQEIPSIRFGKDFSPAKIITVKNAAPPPTSQSTEEVFFELDAQPREPYVQAQVIYTIRLYRAVNTQNSSLTEPQLSGAKAVIKKLGDDINFETHHQGRPYLVVERKYAIFPQSSGSITIEPVVFTGQLSTGRRFLFDSFQSKPRILRARSKAIQLNARPIPDLFNGRTWLPANQIQLYETWSQEPPEFKVGEPITRTLALIAGGLTSGQLPELQPALPEAFKQYPDQPSLEDSLNPDGVLGKRQEKIALIPSKAGEFLLPEIEIPWWNTETQHLEYARLPARKVTVQATPSTAIQHSTPPVISIKPDSRQAQTSFNTAITADTLDNNTQAKPMIWIVISTALALGWSVTLILWWRSHRPTHDPLKPDAVRSNTAKTIKGIRRACERGDPVATKNALLAWSATRWPDDPATSLGLLAGRCSGDLAEEIQRLSLVLYGQAADPWKGAKLWTAFNRFASSKPQRGKSQDQGLEPLFRI